MTGIKTITSERYACEYCGADGSYTVIVGRCDAVPMITEKREGTWDKWDVSEHILKQHPQKVLERLQKLEDFVASLTTEKQKQEAQVAEQERIGRIGRDMLRSRLERWAAL